MVEFVKYTSILGNITIAVEADTLIGLWFDGQKYDRADMQGEFSTSISTMARKTIKWLDEYFSGKNPEMTLKISPNCVPESCVGMLVSNSIRRNKKL